jgi:hypothetical protein
VIVGEVDVPVVEVHGVGVVAVLTPENATAPHTNPAAPDRKLFPVMVVLVLAVKPVICHTPTEALLVVVFDVKSVTVPPAGLRVIAVPALNEFAFVPEAVSSI